MRGAVLFVFSYDRLLSGGSAESSDPHGDAT